MKINKSIIALAVMSTTLTGCGDDAEKLEKAIGDTNTNISKKVESSNKEVKDSIEAQLKENIKKSGIESKEIKDEISKQDTKIARLESLVNMVLNYGDLKAAIGSIDTKWTATKNGFEEEIITDKDIAAEIALMDAVIAKYVSDSSNVLDALDLVGFVKRMDALKTAHDKKLAGYTDSLIGKIASEDSREAVKALIKAPKKGFGEAWSALKRDHLSDGFDDADLPTLKALSYALDQRADKGQSAGIQTAITEITNLKNVFVKVKALADAGTEGEVGAAQAAIEELYDANAPLIDMEAEIMAKALAKVPANTDVPDEVKDGGGVVTNQPAIDAATALNTALAAARLAFTPA